MITFKYLGRALLLGILMMPIGCVRDLDLDQSDEIALQPKYDLDLFRLDLNQDSFVKDDVVQETEVHQTTHLDFINDQAVQKNLKQIDFDFITVNTFTQGFQAIFNFLDSDGNVTYSIEMNVPGSENGNPQDYVYRETLTGEALDAFKTSVDLDVAAFITLDSNPIEGNLKFKSKALFYFEF